MRVLAAVLFCLWSLAAAAQTGGSADTPGSADRAAIRAVITRQLEAFRRDDAGAAFAFASPGIQAMFGTPENFLAMVRTGYAPVYRPRASEFRDLLSSPDGPVQQVLIVGPDGRSVMALYSMEREADGSWRISGCILVPLTDQTA